MTGRRRPGHCGCGSRGSRGVWRLPASARYPLCQLPRDEKDCAFPARKKAARHKRRTVLYGYHASLCGRKAKALFRILLVACSRPRHPARSVRPTACRGQDVSFLPPTEQCPATGDVPCVLPPCCPFCSFCSAVSACCCRECRARRPSWKSLLPAILHRACACWHSARMPFFRPKRWHASRRQTPFSGIAKPPAPSPGGKDKPFLFRADAALLAKMALTNGIAVTANNHVFDGLAEGAANLLALLAGAGIRYNGLYTTASYAPLRLSAPEQRPVYLLCGSPIARGGSGPTCWPGPGRMCCFLRTATAMACWRCCMIPRAEPLWPGASATFCLAATGLAQPPRCAHSVSAA